MRNSHRSRKNQMHHRHDYQQQGQPFPHLSGAIFMCCNKTRKECFRRRIFGLPASREPFVRQVKEGMYLFLFGADDRKMRGVFKAASNGGMNIVPGAFRSSGSHYPAQVQFNIECIHEPLTETEFRPAIQEKYFTDVKFNFDLNSDQVQRLLVLFEAKKGSWVPQPISDRWDPSSSIDSPLNWSYSNRQRNIMSRMNNLGQRTLQVQITNPNPTTGGSMLFMSSNSNFHQQDVVNSTSLCLAQQQESFEYQTGTGTGTDTGVLYAQTMVPHLLHVNSGNQQVALSGFNHLSLSSSSQAGQVYAPNPLYSRNIIMGVSTSSNFSNGDGQVHNRGGHLHGQFCNAAPQNHYCSNISQDVGIVGDIKTCPLAKNPCFDQNSIMVCSVYPSELGKQPDKNSNSDPDPNLRLDADLSLHADPNPNPSLYSDVEQRKSVFSRLAENTQIASRVKHSHLTGVDPSINQIPGHLIQHSMHQTGLNRADEPVQNKSLVQDEELAHIHGLACADIEVSPNLSGVVDGMDLDPTASISNLKVELDESKLPLVDFKRRNGGNTLRTQLGREKKKRKLIRPSLELEDENSDLCALEGPMHKVDMSSDKQSIEPFLVSIESVYNREIMVITGSMDVEGRVESGTSEVLPAPVCKTTENFQTEVTTQWFQDNHEEEKVFLHSIGMETAKDNPYFARFQDPFCIITLSKESDSYLKAESLGPYNGEHKDESNDLLVLMKVEREKQKNDFEDSQGPLFKAEVCLQTVPGKPTVDLECVVETKSNGSEKILVSESEKSDTLELDPKSLIEGVNCSEGQVESPVLDALEPTNLKEASVNCSEGLIESLILDEKTEKKILIPNLEPIISEPENEIKDERMLEPESDNSKSLCLHNETSNLVEEYIPLGPEADNLKTGLVGYIAVKSGTFELEPTNLKEAGVNCSDGQMKSLVLDEKTEKKILIPNLEPIISEPENEIKDERMLEPESDNSKSLCLHNETSNLVEEYIPLGPEADNLKTGLVGYIAVKSGTFELEPTNLKEAGVNCSDGQMKSLVLDEKTENKNPIPKPEPIISELEIEIKDDSVLEPEPNNSKSMCLPNETSNLVEEYIPLEPETNSLKTGLEEYIALEPDAIY